MTSEPRQPASRDGASRAPAAVDYRRVFEAAPAPYLLLAGDPPRYTIVDVNTAYMAATGTRREAIVGRPLFEVFPDNPEDLEADGVGGLRASLDRVVRDRTADVMGLQKYDIPLPDHPETFEVRYWSPINTPVTGPGGEVTHIIHRVEDVTEFVLAQQGVDRIEALADRRQAEVLRNAADLREANRQLKEVTGRLSELNALQAAQAQARLSFAMNSAGMGELILDPATDRTVHSPGMAKLLGFAGDRLLTREEIRQAVHPEDQAQVAAHRDAAIAGPGEAFETEHRVVWPDGSVRWLVNRGRVARDGDGRATEITAVFMDITERKQAEERQTLLLAELNHRMKNTLATVMALAGQTRRGAADMESFGRTFEARLRALSTAHDLLSEGSWNGASLADVLLRTLAPYSATPGRVRAEGPAIRLSPNAAVTMSMAIHELATNAAKYGALSTGDGRLSVDWTVDISPAPGRLAIRWVETGGPAVATPPRRGFGSRLIEQALARELGGEARLLFPPEGVQCEIDLPLSHKVSPG